jgi:hypothetical protein
MMSSQKDQWMKSGMPASFISERFNALVLDVKFSDYFFHTTPEDATESLP